MISLKELNAKIKSLQNTGKITKAMQLIAANRFAKAKKKLQDSHFYKENLQSFTEEVLKDEAIHEHPFFVGTPKRKEDAPQGRVIERDKESHLILVTSERGLCGPYNNNVIRRAGSVLEEWQHEGKIVRLHCIGKRGYDAFKHETDLLYKWHSGSLIDEVPMEGVTALMHALIHLYLHKDAGEICVLYHHFKSSMKQEMTCKRLLPMPLPSPSEKEAPSTTHNASAYYLYEPDKKTLAEDILTHQLECQLYDALLNAATSEHASRMTAMDNATRNGQEMIDDYTLMKNRVRQASITTELSEVVSGAEALKA